MTLLAVEAGHHGQVSVWALVVAVLLLLANGLFVAAEIGLLAVRRARIEALADGGDRRAVRALAALRELSVTFSGAQLGITMASLGLGAVAEPAVAAIFARALETTPLPAATRVVVAFALGLSVVVFLHMVVGEMAPKNLALARPERVSLALVRPFGTFVRLLRPVILLLNASANAVVRLTGVEPRDEIGLVHTPDELALTLRESRRHGTLAPQDARVMMAALALGEIDAGAAMTPRTDLVALDAGAPAAAVLERAGETGFTRFSVFRGDLDDIVGVVHVKDALVRDEDELAGLRVAELVRPLPAVPESRGVVDLLRDMRRERAHAVLVVDEFGSTAGMVTLEDVLEELVGDIIDEFDAGVEAVRRLTGRRWLVRGTVRCDELRRATGLELPLGEYETVSGYLTQQLGRLVRRGDVVHHGGWRLAVRSVDGRRAGEVEVVAPPEPPAGPAGAGSSPRGAGLRPGDA